MRLHETCTCGAEIEVDGTDSAASCEVRIWRRDHLHREPQSECNEAPEQRGVSGSVVEFGFIPDYPRPAEVTA